ncbi:hypothetical protein [Azohydromonas caseinilytica]|uniref:Uncharacterized protein n=1 Tax=Azohydromonas caseinilytica TaxID=2728836 RepID=A0A848FAD9_9BURK|nr:hypothetical protein [Azohydromonas caseinilytica]NML17137.1 hypothetical protein [Azohydromonas caseinilytica]
MSHEKTEKFWETVLRHADVLSAPVHLEPETPEWERAVEQATDLVTVLDDAAKEVDQRLSVEINQVPQGEGSAILLAISCGCDPEGIDAVLALVEAAPALPAGLSTCAFKPPVPREVAESFGAMEIADKQVPISALRYLAKPSASEPGAYDIACFVPSTAVTDMDHGIPGSLASQLVLGLGLGELKLMTRVARIGVAVTDAPPEGAVTSWELNEVLDQAAAPH